MVENRMLKWFAFEHLKGEARIMAENYADMAEDLDALLHDGPEKTVALRKLLESMDAAVRSAIHPGC